MAAILLGFVAGGAARTIVSGAVASMVHTYDVGALSAPPVLRALTWNTRAPSASPVNTARLVHAAKPRPSTRQRKTAPGCLLENVKVAVVSLLGFDGPESI